jgi:hypothetical protein
LVISKNGRPAARKIRKMLAEEGAGGLAAWIPANPAAPPRLLGEIEGGQLAGRAGHLEAPQRGGGMKKRDKPMAALPARQQSLAGAGELLGDLRNLIENTRLRAAQAVNVGLAMLCWNIGARIYREILKQKRAEYGKQIVGALSRQLTGEYGPGQQTCHRDSPQNPRWRVLLAGLLSFPARRPGLLGRRSHQLVPASDI